MSADGPISLMNPGKETPCKPFQSSHAEQIKLVTDFSWISFSALSGIEEEYREIVRGSVYIDQTRLDALCKALKDRCRMLEKVALCAMP